jgi:NAD(P)-dependent dehydrogenase (short-subunit alcohol dehydrogenase family)
MDVSGRTILITGATDGLGRGLAAELAKLGGTVLVHGRDGQRAERTLAELRELGATGDSASTSPTSARSRRSARWPSGLLVSGRPSTCW